MGRVPRHLFVSHVDPRDAYSDRALPTSQGQTISQPYMVAMMTELLRVTPGLRVLEVGTGSGYQTAVLAHMGAQVVSIERSEELAQQASRAIDEQGWSDRVKIVEGDGTLGWPRGGPYDRVIVTAGAPRLPRAYQEQLADRGRVVIPIGDSETQHIYLFERASDRWVETRSIGCKFVPLVGQDGWPDA